MTTVTLDNQSLYKDTPVFDDNDGDGPRFGLWHVPSEFSTPGAAWKTHIVRQGEVGFLDAIAARSFGPGYEKLWRGIAIANNIIDPEVDMYPGMRLVIPPASVASTFTNRGPVT